MIYEIIVSNGDNNYTYSFPEEIIDEVIQKLQKIKETK